MRITEGLEDGVGVIDEPLSGSLEDRSHTSSHETPVVHAPEMIARIPLLNNVLSNRELRRVIAFLFAGGVSALVTIAVTKLFFDVVLRDSGQFQFPLAALIGTEVGILVNFTINDRLAFRDLSGHKRPFLVRILRFHVTCATGQTLILLISWALHDGAKLGTVVSQALPIVFVTGINFALHRFWTYRGVHTKPHAQ